MTETPTDLYRYFDASGVLLYVGISLSAIGRAIQHRDTAAWWPQQRSMTRESFPTRAAALLAERNAIIKERPIYNVKHNGRRGGTSAWSGFKCEACSAVAMYIQLDRDDGWHSVCMSHDTTPSPRYWIGAERIKTQADLEHWTEHLGGKRWFDHSDWYFLIESCWTNSTRKAHA